MVQTTSPTPSTETQLARFGATHRALTDALKVVALAVPRTTAIPEQYGVIADAQGSTVTLRAFDFETAVSVRVDAEPGSAGRSLLSHAELKEVLAACVAGETSAVAARTPVSVAGDVLSTPDLSVPLNTLELGNYPNLPPAAPPMVTVDGAEFFRQAARVLPAVGTDDTLPTLACVRVEIRGEALRMIATDRYRVAVAEVPSDAWDGGEPDTVAMVPGYVFAKVVRLLGKYTGPVSVGVHTVAGAPWATFGVGATEITVRGVFGEYPEVTKLVPTTACPVTVGVDRAAMVKAVRKAAALAKAKADRGPIVDLAFGPDGRVTVSPWVKDAATRAKIKGVDVNGRCAVGAGGQGTELLANGAYLLDALGAFAGDTVTVHVRGAVGKPFLLTDGEAVAGEGYRHLLMPLNPEHIL